MTRDISGLSSPASFAYYDRESSSLRTSQATFDLGFTPSLPTLPTWGWMSGGELYERVMSALPISEQGSSSLLPTPNAAEGRQSIDSTHKGGNPTLASVQRLLPPPRVSAANGPSQSELDAGDPKRRLETTVALLPTPTACDHKGAGLNPQRYADRSQLAGLEKLLPTPAAQEPGGTAEAHLWRKNRLDGANRVTPTHLAFIDHLLPTPTGDDANNVTRESGDFQSLARTAHNLLPTPTTQDGANNAGPSQHNRNSDPLNVVAAKMLPTPTSRDHHAQGASQTQLSTLIQKYDPDGIPPGAYTSRPSDSGNTPSDEQPHGQLTIEDA